jgi:hypothetical protein
MITYQRLTEVLSYSDQTGLFKWIKKTSIRCSDIVGHKTKSGYIVIRIDGRLYRAHQLAWMYVYKQFPIKFIDHINLVRDDNRICNLRLVTKKQNSENRVNKNTSTGIRGIIWDKQRKKYAAYISQNNKTIGLGRFDLIEDAKNAYANAAKIYHTHNNSI